MATPAVTILSRSLSVQTRAVVVALLLAIFAISAALYSQYVWGLQPCELCLLQRWPYYLGIPVAVAGLALTLRASPARRSLGTRLLWLLALIFVVSFWLGVFHAGVEWGFWPGPTACTGSYAPAASTDDFLKSLETAAVVRCDAASIRVLGLSLAGWNAVASLVIASLAFIGARAAGPR
jgi:disulfide bond formation protein DsbB